VRIHVERVNERGGALWTGPELSEAPRRELDKDAVATRGIED
jgi:hypothetical protein